jgi:hypothetical protein
VLSGDNRQKYNWGCVAKLENMDGISIEWTNTHANVNPKIELFGELGRF